MTTKTTKRKPIHRKPLDQWKGPAQVTKTGEIMPISPGRPRRVFSARQVYLDAHKGLNKTDIAARFKMDRGTLDDHLKADPEFAHAFERGRADLHAEIMKALIDNAIKSKSVVAQIWLSKNLLGFSDSPKHFEHEISGEITYIAEWGGGPPRRKELAAADDDDVVDVDAEEADEEELS
jgi:hypothetical protein